MDNIPQEAIHGGGPHFPVPFDKDAIDIGEVVVANGPDFIMECTVTVRAEYPGDTNFPTPLREWTVSYKAESAEEASTIYENVRLAVTSF